MHIATKMSTPSSVLFQSVAHVVKRKAITINHKVKFKVYYVDKMRPISTLKCPEVLPFLPPFLLAYVLGFNVVYVFWESTQCCS